MPQYITHKLMKQWIREELLKRGFHINQIWFEKYFLLNHKKFILDAYAKNKDEAIAVECFSCCENYLEKLILLGEFFNHIIFIIHTTRVKKIKRLVEPQIDLFINKYPEIRIELYIDNFNNVFYPNGEG